MAGSQPTGPSTGIIPPSGSKSIAAQGKYLLPGLWDMHVHLRGDQKRPDVRLPRENEAILDLFLPNGVVGIREMGGDLSDQVIQWRNEIRAGKREGPRILTAGRKIDRNPPEWAGSIGVSTADEARQAVQQMRDSGADFIKAYFQRIPPEIFEAVIDEAHKQHLKVTGHKPDNMSIQEFIETGIDGMEHESYLPATVSREQYDSLQHERSSRLEKPWAMDGREFTGRLFAMRDDKQANRVYRLMAEKQFWVTPTVAMDVHQRDYGVSDYESDDRRRYFFPAIWATWDPKTSFRRPIPSRAEILPLVQAVSKWREEATLAAFKAGVPMLAGTDCGANNVYMMPGWALHEEMQALVRIGLTPADALRMATIDGAKWRGAADEGSIEEGKIADLVLVRSNPLTDIRHTLEIDSVFQGGRYYSRADLDLMLKRSQERAAAAAQPVSQPR